MVSLAEIATFVVLVAVAGLLVLDTVLGSWQRGPVALLALFTTYLMGIALVYIRVSPAIKALVSPAAVRRFARFACAVACALPLLFAMPLMPFRFLTVDW
jgi:hypothetical protein